MSTSEEGAQSHLSAMQDFEFLCSLCTMSHGFSITLPLAYKLQLDHIEQSECEAEIKAVIAALELLAISDQDFTDVLGRTMG